MPSIVGIDSRIFKRENIKRNGEQGHFESILGIAVKVRNYVEFDIDYQNALQLSFEENGKEINYTYYCTNDIKDYNEKDSIIQTFAENISDKIEKIHVFYTLFSEKHEKEVKVYGRLSRKEHIT
jgi:NADH:ubiquinone oxidoreductase subunit C